MANRIVTATVTGETIKLSEKSAGAAGSFNAVSLAFTFDSAWDGTTSKIVQFLDAYGANPVNITLTSGMIVSGAYIVPIPAEPLAHAGEMTITVRGVDFESDGETAERIIVSASTTMKVLSSLYEVGGTTPVEPTPTQAEQLLAAVSSVTGMTVEATELETGEPAYVTKSDNVDGTINLEFGLPAGPQGTQGIQGIQGVQGIQGIQGIQGEAATITVGTTTTGAPGTSATVTNVGTAEEAVFNFSIPRGYDGEGSGDMVAAIYDPTNKSADAFSLANMTEDSTHRVVTDTEKSTWNAKQNSTDSLTAETAIVDTDYMPFYDSSATAHRKTLWSNIKSVLKTYFDALYATLTHSHGNLTNDGKIGSTADLPVFTTTNGEIATKSIAAARALLGVWDTLITSTVATAAPSISLDLSGITISNYSAIIIEARVLTSATTTTEVTLNNLTSGYYGNILSSGNTAVSKISNGASISGFRSRATSTDAYPTNISLKISCPFISGTPTNYCYTNVDFSGGETDISTSGHIWGSCSVPTSNNALSSVQFNAGTVNIAVGSTFYVYGVKK